MDCTASDHLLGVISKDEIGECNPFSFSDANPAIGLFGTVGRKGVIDRVEDRTGLSQRNRRRAEMSVFFPVSSPMTSEAR
jgi:hypothetical protein